MFYLSRRNVTVETVKEMVMSEDDKKIPEDKDGERTDGSVKTELSAPLSTESQKPASKQRTKPSRSVGHIALNCCGILIKHVHSHIAFK